MKVTNLITADILQGIDDINKKCHAMHIPSPPVQFFNAEVRDADGELVEVLKSKSNSWVRNAYNFLAQVFLPCDTFRGASDFGAGSQSLKDTGNGTRRSDGFVPSIFQGSTYSMYNNAASSDFGILAGTSDAAESFENNALGALIAHGTGAGQFSYAAGSSPTTSYDAGAKKWVGTFFRSFANNSGASIMVKEIGIAYSMLLAPSSSGKLLISRDVLATPVTVENGQTLTITYTSEITYPA